jgi:hypothetical protein
MLMMTPLKEGHERSQHFVAAELSRRGYIASISLRNTRGIDIIVTNRDASRSITIQCKTNQLARKVWILNEKSEDFILDAHFYVFVALGGVLERPSYHVVPSSDVAAHTSAEHRQSLQTPPDISMLTTRCGSLRT